MSAGPELSADLVAVACVVEASLVLATEWSRILIDYIYPLLKRLSELHPSRQFRLAFVTYGAADTRPLPLLCKKFFSPLSQITKEIREEPSKLGIGQTNSGSGRGLCALEGYVAAIELFDILMMSTNSHPQIQSPQKDNRSVISHILHIAASPPDNAQRPQWNTLQHLDSLNWDSIPAELKKRKINLSLISLKKIPQFQEVQSSVAGSGAQTPWFNVRAPHMLSLAGFPTPQKAGAGTKRQTDTPLSDQSPDMKRQKVVVDPVSKTSSASPALQPRIPSNQRSQQPGSSQTPQPPLATITSQNPPSTQSAQTTPSIPVSTPTPSAPPPLPVPATLGISAEILAQVVAPTTFTFGQLMDRLKTTEREVATIDLQISNAQNAGKPEIVAGLRQALLSKTRVRDQIKILLRQHYQKILIAREASNTQAGAVGSAPSSGSAEAGPSTLSQPPNAPSASTEQPMEEHKPDISDAQVLTQFWHRGGATFAPNSSNAQTSSSQTQPNMIPPDVVIQMQKLTEKKEIRPQNPGSSSKPSISHETDANPNPVAPIPNALAWAGTFSWAFPNPSGQMVNEVPIHVLAFSAQSTASNLRTDTWPKNLSLIPCKVPLKDYISELQSWGKRHRPLMIRFIPNPRVPDASLNNQRFQTLHKFMSDQHIYVYTGWKLSSDKFSYNMIVFSMAGSFVGAMFADGLPDLPGSGNALDAQPPVEETKPQTSNVPSWSLALKNRLQGLEPAQQKQVMMQIFQSQRLEQLRRQQLQQTLQPHPASSQSLNSLGISIPPNPYGAVANIPSGPQANVNGPINSGAFNTGNGSGTVNYEMLQSFMQRSAEGSTSQSGQMS